MKNNKKILAVIPAFNEGNNITDVIDSIKKKFKWIDILVVNDGSRDDTGIRAEINGNALVANLVCNVGIGGAVQTGFIFARQNDYDIVFQFDGDGQHLAEEIPALLEPILGGEADVVNGSRFCQKHNGFRSTLSRRIGNKFFALIISLLIRQSITDSTTGFRAFNRKAIKFLSVNYPHDYPEPEAILLLGKNNFIIKEVFTRMTERCGGASSINGLLSIYYMIKVLLAILVTALRPKLPEV